MVSTRAVAAAFFLAQMMAGALLAQEFGRSTGGEMELLAKRPATLSGSLGLSMSTSGSGLRGFEGSLGGTVVEDRLWFFVAGQRDTGRFTLPELRPISTAVAQGSATAQIGSRQTLLASAGTGKELLGTTPATLPSSFLSMHYTGIVSSSSFFTATVSRRSATQPQPGFVFFGPRQ